MALKIRKLRWKEKKSTQHVCDLRKGSESHLPRLPPNAQFSVRFKRRLQKILLVSANHPFTRHYLRSKAAIAFEKRRHGISPHWWVIHPCSSFRFIWDVVMTFTFLYMFIMIPHVMAFYRLPKGDEIIMSDIIKVLTPGYVICLIDILFNFITGFISKKGHDIFLDPLLIMKNYIGRFFIIDLISSIPYMWFHEVHLETPGKDVRFYLVILEAIPLLKFFRMSSVRHYVKEIVVACGASRVYEHGIWILCLTLLIFHWAACFTYAFPFFYAYGMKTSMKIADGYVFKTELYKKSTWHIYLTSLHMGVGNLCSYSYNEFKFTDLPDKVTRCILLLFGMGYYLYVIVIILQLVSSSAEPELKYQSIMHGVKDYINNKRLPENLKRRLLHFYEHRFQGSLFREQAITSTLSKHLNYEIKRHNGRILLESTPLFNNIPRSLLNSIIGVLKPVIFLQDDVIYKWGMTGKCMYFVVTGTVAVFSHSGKEICHIKDGDYFGEIAMVQHDHKRTTTVIALEACEVLRLDRRDYNRLVQPKTNFYSRLQSVARKRMQDIEDAEDEHLTSVRINEFEDTSIRNDEGENDERFEPAENNELEDSD